MAELIKASDADHQPKSIWHVVVGYLASCTFLALLFTLLRFVSEFRWPDKADASLWLLPLKLSLHVCFIFAVIAIVTLPAFMLLRALLAVLPTTSWLSFFLAGAASAALVTFYALPGIGYYLRGADASDFVFLASLMVAGGGSGVVAYLTERALLRRSLRKMPNS